MEMLDSCYKKTIGIFNHLKWLPSLLARITIGAVFIESGWGKLHNLPKVIDFFHSLGIPYAEVQAPFVAGEVPPLTKPLESSGFRRLVVEQTPPEEDRLTKSAV
jgi:hypothetical protein